jgi:hypothetical protein
MATTTNYGWTTPDDTALVKDGASAIRSLGTSVDTTTKNLNPSTTLGDIEYRSSTANTNTRLGIGTTGQVLTVAGGVPSWATPSSGSTFAGCRLTKSVGQTLTNNADTIITWDVETFDVGGYHDNVTNNSRITIPSGKAGYYQINAALSYAATGAGTRIIQIAKNGVTFTYNLVVVGANASGYETPTFSDVIYGAVGDYFEVGGLQSSGGNLNVIGNNGDPGACNFSMFLIGA